MAGSSSRIGPVAPAGGPPRGRSAGRRTSLRLGRCGLALRAGLVPVSAAAQSAPPAPARSSPAAGAPPAAPRGAPAPAASQPRTPAAPSAAASQPRAPAAPASRPGPAEAAAPAKPAAPSPPRVTLADPVLSCRTLSELLLWDNKETDGEVLRRTVAEQTCRNLPGGTLVSVAETATIRGTAYQCLAVEGETECLWAGAIGR